MFFFRKRVIIFSKGKFYIVEKSGGSGEGRVVFCKNN